MKPKTKKIWKIVLNAVVYIIFALILFLTVMIVKSGGKGYTSIFGTAFVAVKTDSMDGDREDSFAAGALLKVKVLSDEDKTTLQVGDVISFYDTVDGKVSVNSHRIVEVWGEGYQTVFYTQGDKTGIPDAPKRTLDEVIGKVVGHANGIGNFFLFLHTPAGFGVCVILPCLLLLGYCVFDLVLAVREQKRREKKTDKELMKEELLKELLAEGKISPDREPIEGNREVGTEKREESESNEPKDKE